MKRILLLAAACVVAGAIGFGSMPASAQTAPSVNTAALDSLPADVQTALANALQSGNANAIGVAITAALLAHPDLAAQIAGQAAVALPSAAATIASSAIAVAVRENASPATIQAMATAITLAAPSLAPQIATAATVAVTTNNGSAGDIDAVAAGVTTGAPTQAAQIAVAVFTALPIALQTDANKTLIGQTVIDTVASLNNGTNASGPVTAALNSIVTPTTTTTSSSVTNTPPVSPGI